MRQTYAFLASCTSEIFNKSGLVADIVPKICPCSGAVTCRGSLKLGECKECVFVSSELGYDEGSWNSLLCWTWKIFSFSMTRYARTLLHADLMLFLTSLSIDKLTTLLLTQIIIQILRSVTLDIFEFLFVEWEVADVLFGSELFFLLKDKDKNIDSNIYKVKNKCLYRVFWSKQYKLN